MRRNERQDSSHYRHSDLQHRHDKVLRACTINHLDWNVIAFDDKGMMLDIDAAERNLAQALNPEWEHASQLRAIVEQEILADILAGLNEA